MLIVSIRDVMAFGLCPNAIYKLEVRRHNGYNDIVPIVDTLRTQRRFQRPEDGVKRL